MARHHLVRVGAMGQVGRFASVDATRYPRHSSVIVRTRRGLEVGEVLSPPQTSSAGADGQILRGMTVEDQLLQARLDQKRTQAYQACVALLAERKLEGMLMDVEHLFDGVSLYFYFLGPVQPEVEALTRELAEAYEAQVQMRQFSETLLEGCGPGCGTAEAEGGACDGCSTGCAVKDVCKTH